MNRSVIFIKVVWHGLNLVFHVSGICPLFEYYVAFTGVLLTSGQYRMFSISYCSNGTFNRAGVLLGILYALNASNGIGMPLRYPLAPEGIVTAIGEYAIAKQSGQGEQARIPADRNHSGLSIGAGRFIHFCKMLRNVCMGIKGINDIKHFCISRSLLR